MNSLDQSLQSEFQEFRSQFQQQEKVINNPESLSFQYKVQGQSPHSSFQLQSVEQQSLQQLSLVHPQELQQVEISETSQFETEQYLNISFQDIIQLIFNNQCSQLNKALKTIVFRSYVLINLFTLLNIIFILNEVIALYFSLITKDKIKELFSVYFGFNLISDCLITYLTFQLRYLINDAEQINQGDTSTQIIEYLKYTIKINSPFEDIVEDEEQLTQAQQVGISISEKITTMKWLTYLLENQNSQMFALNRVCLLTKIILFAWGNITIVQWVYLNWDNNNINMDQLESILIILTVFSMLIGYIMIILLVSFLLVICVIIPIIIGMAIWQSCNWCTYLYNEYQLHRVAQQRQRFLNNLNPQKFEILQEQDESIHEECAICLSTYQMDDNCVKLPCNVDSGNRKINHVFHDTCILVWIQTCGSCPICRTVFIERYEQ
ncbi:unnamed protein product (macronuclear) [Paramecium tetraurelia]|uniref:RING-type domain-containing protein n=1 Tax=Paramecium tetraurelia TaxID=5888 RepID=A0DHK4_PARTE|nr:uncharacterized protein GSPATT00016908001 [Paramecium tetraurelia]CAK82521.1 unnamed protein product [Paramecium tetraurelia]|eukprot:XP_001449918.1 hypothetical protein (macronuclear) [Paramecium tetraurelia strain d4-2]